MDLIIYSNLCTDSKASIEKILQVAEKNNLKVISITDRNTAIAHITVKQMNISKFYSGIITRMRDKFDRELFINNGIQGNFEPLSFSKSFTETTTEKSKQWNAPKNSETYEKM